MKKKMEKSKSKEWHDLPIEEWPEGSWGFVRDLNGAKILGEVKCQRQRNTRRKRTSKIPLK
jgi:hypothetical protein